MLIFDSLTEVPLPKDFGQFQDVNGVNGRPRMVRTGQCEYVSKSLFFKLNRIILMIATQVPNKSNHKSAAVEICGQFGIPSRNNLG